MHDVQRVHVHKRASHLLRDLRGLGLGARPVRLDTVEEVASHQQLEDRSHDRRLDLPQVIEQADNTRRALQGLENLNLRDELNRRVASRRHEGILKVEELNRTLLAARAACRPPDLKGSAPSQRFMQLVLIDQIGRARRSKRVLFQWPGESGMWRTGRRAGGRTQGGSKGGRHCTIARVALRARSVREGESSGPFPHSKAPLQFLLCSCTLRG